MDGWMDGGWVQDVGWGKLQGGVGMWCDQGGGVRGIIGLTQHNTTLTLQETHTKLDIKQRAGLYKCVYDRAIWLLATSNPSMEWQPALLLESFTSPAGHCGRSIPLAKTDPGNLLHNILQPAELAELWRGGAGFQ